MNIWQTPFPLEVLGKPPLRPVGAELSHYTHNVKQSRWCGALESRPAQLLLVEDRKALDFKDAFLSKK